MRVKEKPMRTICWSGTKNCQKMQKKWLKLLESRNTHFPSSGLGAANGFDCAISKTNLAFISNDLDKHSLASFGMVTDPPRNYDCAPAVAPRIGRFYLRIGHHLTKKQDCPTAFELGAPQMPLGCRPST